MERRTSFQINRSVTVGELVSIVMIILAAITLWYHQDGRLSAVEKTASTNAATDQKLSGIVDRMEKNQEKMQQVLSDFPVHRHVGSVIVYPNRVNFDPVSNSDDPPPRQLNKDGQRQ